MRIGIDVTFLHDQYANRGIGTYGKELISRLLLNRDHTWVLFGFANRKINFKLLNLKKPSNVEFISLGNARKSSPFNLLFFKMVQLNKITKAKLDLYFAPHFERGLPIGKVKVAVTVHDIIPLITEKYSEHRGLGNFLKGLFYKHNLNQAKKADLILTDSDFSKRELVNKAQFPERKVMRIYPGISERFKKSNIAEETRDIRRVLVMYNITKPYLLYYGGLEANKNIPVLLSAFKNITDRHPDMKLVLAGKEFKVGWDNKPVPLTKSAQDTIELIDELRLKHKVILTGQIETNHLPIVLSNAEVFIHLSIYEGFGFSPLEALSAGTPAVVARRSCYPEVLQDGVTFVDPKNIEQISQAIQTILQDEKYRQEIIHQGMKVSAGYSWNNAVASTIGEFSKLLSRVEPLHIGYVIPNFYPTQGGAENNCLELAQAMVRKGHCVTVLTANNHKNSLPAKEEFAGIKILRHKRWNNQYYLGFYPGLFKSLFSNKFDLIHVHGFGFIWHDFCLWWRKLLLAGTKYLNTPHGPFMAHTFYTVPQKILKKLYTFAQRLFLNGLYQKIIAVNPEQSNWITKYGIKKEKIIYLPNGIKEEYFVNITPKKSFEELGLSKKFMISSIGRYEKYKGMQDIISALPELIKTKKNLKLILMGNPGAQLEFLQQQVKDLQLDKYVEILVTPDDELKKEILFLSKIFIMASEWEAFGISTLEAMAMGNAVISTRTEGGEFLVKDSENGYLYEFGDVQELTNLVLKLMQDSKLLNTIKSNNIEKARSFLWEKIADNYHETIQTLVK